MLCGITLPREEGDRGWGGIRALAGGAGLRIFGFFVYNLFFLRAMAGFCVKLGVYDNLFGRFNMLNLKKTGAILAVMLLAACVREQTIAVPPEGMKCEESPKEEVWVPMPVSRAGIQYCPNNRRCTGEPLLPPQPCEQPMPTYYDNLSETEVAEGVLLIHPLTRAKVLCFDQSGWSAVECAEYFRAAGYMLATDIPQFAGRYDFLREGTYPARRWRKDEHIPRW